MEKIIMKKIDEVIYHEELENGLNVYIYKKCGFAKKGAFFVTHYGSSNNEFVPIGENDMVSFPKGIAHFLEHKLFESSDNEKVFEKFKKYGADVNAFTNHLITNYYFSCTDNFYPCLEELLNFVLSPYFTDENVEKEKPIINEEINMTSDNVDRYIFEEMFNMTLNTNPNKYRTIGDKINVSKITKEDLYRCYNTFYNPSNMVLVVSGDFEPEKILEEIKKRLIDKKSNGEIKRIYPDEPENIVKEKIEQKLEVSQPVYAIGIKDKVINCSSDNVNEIVKKHIAIEILLNLIIGRSSELYKKLYNEGIIYTQPSLDYEFGKTYAHVLITGQSNNPEKVYEEFKKEISKMKENGVNKEDAERIKKMIYGGYIKEYDDVVDISRMFLADYFKGINSFDYLDEIEGINVEYLNQMLNNVFKEEKMVISIVKN